MNVQAKRAFVARVKGAIHRHSEGDVFPLPTGVDWLECGLVKPVGKPAAAKRTRAKSKQAEKREKR